MELIFGFACGIAFKHLIDFLKCLKDDKFKVGEEDVCSGCTYKKAVMETLEDVQAK